MLLALYITFMAVLHVSGRTCINCQYTANPNNNGIECITSPKDFISKVTMTCKIGTECYVQKKIDRVTGELYALTRGCKGDHERPDAGCKHDWAHSTCVATCDAHLCNNLDETVVVNNNTADEDHGQGYVMCHACTFLQGTGQPTCVNDPASHPSIKCYGPKRCYTGGQWSIIANRYQTFSRGCENVTMEQSTCNTTDLFDNCLKVCGSDHCNNETGRIRVEDGYQDLSCLDEDLMTTTAGGTDGGSEPAGVDGTNNAVGVFKNGNGLGYFVLCFLLAFVQYSRVSY